MSMSTNIADLPGPAPEDMEDNLSQESFEDVRERIEPQVQRRQIPKENLYEQPSRIKMDIKKVNKIKAKNEELGVFDIIKNEVNEENLLILIVLYIASTPLIDDYVKKILNIMSFNTSSSLVVNILKCVILLLVFILAKHILLPYIRV
jgi:hypothetical protein